MEVHHHIVIYHYKEVLYTCQPSLTKKKIINLWLLITIIVSVRIKINKYGRNRVFVSCIQTKLKRKKCERGFLKYEKKTNNDTK